VYLRKEANADFARLSNLAAFISFLKAAAFLASAGQWVFGPWG
jgi:hypothetical protein